MESNSTVIENYRTLAAKHMIPYAGSALDANVYKNIKYLYDNLDHALPIWLLGASRERLMSPLLDNFGTVEGSSKDEFGLSRKFWTSEIGLIILVSDSFNAEVRKNLRIDERLTGYSFPDLDWLANSLEKDGFVLNTKESKLTWLRNCSDSRKAELEAGLEKQARERLQKEGVVETTETMNLSKEVGRFDVYYDYSDDHFFCIRYRAYERDLRAKLKALNMEAVLDNYIRSKAVNAS